MPSPASALSTTESSPATAVRCRGTPSALATSACTTTVHTLPGRYLPSWPMNSTPDAGPSGSGEPRSAISARQPISVNTSDSSASADDRASAPAETRAMSALTASQFRTTATTTAASTSRPTATRTTTSQRPPGHGRRSVPSAASR